MANFEKVSFHGEFRDYQSRVLDHADQYLSDGKINIVAAPGSGKTVLGLELIRRIGKPCLIFSPTTAIREQWGARFRDLFLEDEDEYENLFSTDLHQIRLVNSITYQALFTAMEKIDLTENDDDSFADVDLVREIRDHNIGTICLDEAHHLKNEWQKALEKLLALAGPQVKIIALTATPPYDSESSEWKRYLAMCGEVDEEISIPELVSQDTLCPHQDYIYFNYPSAAETAVLQEFRDHAFAALEEAGALPFWGALTKAINEERDFDRLFTDAGDYIALLVLLRYYGFDVSRKLIRIMTGKKGLPSFFMEFAERAFCFLVNGDRLTETQKEELTAVFKKHAVYHRGRVELTLNETRKRTLISSVGKLDSIAKIVQSEYEAMGNRLRMLVLTDFIKKESLARITEEEEFSEISVVSIFETLRRTGAAVNLAVLSGSLVILPLETELPDLSYTRTPIAGTRYCVIHTSASSHEIVDSVGRLFARGEIRILVGTKSLLGEGWDAPCVNSLIIASYVGSYVLSNQMRGRAIRIDSNDPAKTANIWHLVTVEPEYLFADKKIEKAAKYLSSDKNTLLSCDYEILRRRFDSFIGPDYETGSIESGIERISYVKPPFDRDGIREINRKMLALSSDRESMRRKWEREVKAGGFRVCVENEIDKEKRVPVFTFFNVAGMLSLSIIESICIRTFANMLSGTRGTGSFFAWLQLLICTALVLYGFFRICRKLVLHFSPARSMKTLGIAVYRVLTECGLILPAARVETAEDKDKSYISLFLRNATVREQNIFNEAMRELLSPIENPRYILIRKSRLLGYRFRDSFACPSVIGKKKEYAELLAQNLKKSTGSFVPVYTRNEEGRALILRCRRRSFISRNQKLIDAKYKVRRWE